MYEQLELFVPDRFDMLLRRAPAQLDTIVVPVDDALQHVKTVHRDMLAAGRGAFLIVRGASGSGKSTFLRTLNLFLEDVEVFVISRSQPIEAALRAASDTNTSLRIIIIDERETLIQVPQGEIESSIHEINEIDNVRQDIWGGMMEVDLWQERKQSLWEQLLNQ